MKKVRKAIIPCAGFGTRFLPATKAVPKEMFPIVDVPSLQYIVDECVDAGITDILIILGKNKKCIEDHFDTSPELEQLLEKGNKTEILKSMRALSDKANFYYVRQPEMNGSGAAVMLGEAFVGNEPFAVVFGDDIVYTGDKPSAMAQLIGAYETTGKSILGVQDMPPEEAIKYGCVLPGAVKGRYAEVKGLVEKPSLDKLPSTLSSMGRFVLTPEIFDIIKTTPKAKNGEVYLTDAIATLASTDVVFAYDFEGRRYDVGDKVGYIRANIEYGLRNVDTADKLKAYLIGLVDELKR